MKVVSAEDMGEVQRGPEEWFTGVVCMNVASASTPDAEVFRVL